LGRFYGTATSATLLLKTPSTAPWCVCESERARERESERARARARASACVRERASGYISCTARSFTLPAPPSLSLSPPPLSAISGEMLARARALSPSLPSSLPSFLPLSPTRPPSFSFTLINYYIKSGPSPVGWISCAPLPSSPFAWCPTNT
jgi:hypothetical protein